VIIEFILERFQGYLHTARQSLTRFILNGSDVIHSNAFLRKPCFAGGCKNCRYWCKYELIVHCAKSDISSVTGRRNYSDLLCLKFYAVC